MGDRHAVSVGPRAKRVVPAEPVTAVPPEQIVAPVESLTTDDVDDQESPDIEETPPTVKKLSNWTIAPDFSNDFRNDAE